MDKGTMHVIHLKTTLQTWSFWLVENYQFGPKRFAVGQEVQETRRRQLTTTGKENLLPNQSLKPKQSTVATIPTNARISNSRQIRKETKQLLSCSLR